MDNSALSKISYGIYVISTWNGETPTGCVANTAMQITLNPSTVVTSINNDSFTCECIKDCKCFCINVLGEHTDDFVISIFGFASGRDGNKFANYEPLIKNNMPVIKDAVAYINCEVVNIIDMDTHSVFIGKVLDEGVLSNDSPMTYDYYHNKSKKTSN